MSEPQGRRRFLYRAARAGLSAAGLVLFGGCAASPGQGRDGAPAVRVARIGYLAGSDEEGAADDSSRLNALRQGLRELGWVEGENLRFEVRLAQGDATDLLEHAVADLVRIPVDVIVALGTPSLRPAVSVTSSLPIVMVQGPPSVVEQGLAASIQRPGGNVTGLIQAPSTIFGKRLELLVETVPHVSRLASMGAGSSAEGAMAEAARALGVQVQFPPVQSERELELAFATLEREAVEAVLVNRGFVTGNNEARIINFVAQRRLPAMYNGRGWVDAGGFMSYGHNSAASYRRAAFYVDRILRGVQPGDLPIESPTSYELVINLPTAAALGLTIPDSVLAQATELLR